MAEISDIMIEKFVKAVLRAANTQQVKKPKACTAEAEVLRVENGMAYVHIPGGAPETPARETIACKAGDIVQVRLENGKASLTGNRTAPPTDDTKAEEAAQLAEAAGEAADEAQETADNIKQYFWFKNGKGSEAGAHVTEVPRAEFQKNPQGGNLLLRSNSVKLRMALITLAELTGTSLTFYDPNTNEWRIKLDTDGAHLKGKTVSNNYSYADLLAQVFRIGYHSALNNEDIVSEFFGYQGFSNYMYARKTMTNTPPSFRSTVHDENGFRFVRDNGTNPQTIGTSVNSYLFESGGLKEDGLRLGWVYAGALRSLTDLNAPETDGDQILVSESENGTTLIDVTYDGTNDRADMDLTGKITAGALTNGLFAETEETLINNTSITAGGVNDSEVSITKAGYYPLAISGIYSSTRYFCTVQFCLKDQVEGSAKIDYMIYNPNSSSRTGTVKARVLWLKTSA